MPTQTAEVPVQPKLNQPHPSEPVSKLHLAISDLIRVYPETDPYFWELSIIHRHFS